MTVIRRDGLTWVANSTGLAHAVAAPAMARALCGAPATNERFAWPIRDFCRVCLVGEAGMAAERKGAARKAS